MARLHREKMRWLLDRAVAGEYAVGELLPRELDLASELDVSRGVAREVLRALEERGVVSVRHGRGATLAPMAEWNLLDREVLVAVLHGPDARAAFLELIESRSLLEPGIARAAAERATSEQRERATQAADRLAQTARRNHSARGMAELNVHRALAAATRNLPLAAMLRPIYDGLEAAAAVLGRRASSADEHDAIVRAVVERDAEQAERATRAHLDALADDVRRGRGALLHR